MYGIDEGNPRTFYVGIRVMIPDTRARQPREEEMKCGSQPADIRVIHRRHRPSSRYVALLARWVMLIQLTPQVRGLARMPLVPTLVATRLKIDTLAERAPVSLNSASLLVRLSTKSIADQ